jgi:hypothetical protein
MRRKIAAWVPQCSSVSQYCTVYTEMMPPLHLKLILLCSWTIPVFTRLRNTNVVFSANCNAASLQWCGSWNIKINEGKTQAIYFSRTIRSTDDVLQLNARDIPFVNNETYLGVSFDGLTTWRHQIENTVAKAFRTYIMIYSLFKSGA